MVLQKRIVLLLALLWGSAVWAQGYRVTVQAPQYKGGIGYLTYRMGKNLNVQDSAAFSPKGTAVFKGNQRLPGGIYVVVFPGKRLSFDFFVSKGQQITIKADTTDLVKKVSIIGEPENNLYLQYQQYVAIKGKQLADTRAAYTAATAANNTKEAAVQEANYNKYNKELMTYRQGLIKNNPNSMMAALLNAMQEPQIPIQKPVTQADSVINYNYYKAHYWDGISFMDERILRTPFFIPKLERYYREVLIQVPDTLIKDIDYKMLLARNSPELYKYMLNWLTDEYMSPKYMGHDAVYVHLFTNYHARGASPWLNSKQMEAVSRRAYMLMENLIGEKAANLEMIDSSGNATPLYGVAAEYIVVCFWDPNCGHCKETIPKIDSVYQATWKQRGVKLYGVLNEDAKTEWVNYIKTNKLGDWIHVYQTKAMEQAEQAAQRPSYRQLYDVTLTPKLYLLDKDKRIIAKNLGWDQLNDLLQTR